MKTQVLAKHLSELSRILRALPDMELTELGEMLKRINQTTDKASMAVNLQTLTALSKFSKQEWIQFIDEFDLPVTIPKSYSVRDVIGKLLTYLKDNKMAQQKILDKAKKTSESSPELLKALSIIMKDAK